MWILGLAAGRDSHDPDTGEAGRHRSMDPCSIQARSHKGPTWGTPSETRYYVPYRTDALFYSCIFSCHPNHTREG